ncbi:MAG TPA: phage holin family protein [Candidatus Eisenbacteria bacterium]|nr:phage holin family protein [Candidatus Eisenbacteria bacterium]
MNEKKESRRAGGLSGSLRRFGDSVLGLFETRVEIFSLEWAEERRNLTRLLLLVFAIVACLQLAIVMGLVFLMLAIGQEYRVAVLGIATLVLLLGVVVGVLWLRAWLKRRPPMFAVTIAELRKDREWIRGDL